MSWTTDSDQLQSLANRFAAWRAVPDTPIRPAPGQPSGLARLFARFGVIFPTIQELCALYTRARPEEQAWVRARLAGQHDPLYALRHFTPSRPAIEGRNHQEWRAGYERYKEEDFDGWLRALLAALALQLTQIDYRDDIMAIGHLAREARLRGVDFALYRRELLRLSDPASAAQVGLREPA